MTYITISTTSIKEIKSVANKLLFLDSSMVISRLPLKKKKFTVIRSPHVTNRSREQFQICKHKWILKTQIPLPLIETAIEEMDLFLENPGISIKCHLKKDKKSEKNYTPIELSV